MPFITRADLSDDRQIKQRPRTTSNLSGATEFGIPFSALTSGPDYSSEVITSSASTLTSTFTGTSATTVYTWAQPYMVLGEAVLSALTPTNSGITQNTDSVYSAWTTTTIDGNLVVLTYSGVSFDLSVNEMVELAPNLYSGNTNTAVLNYLSAGTLDFTGRTIWSDTKGISRTEKLIVSDNPTIGYVLTCSNSEGMVIWAPSSGGTSGGTGNDVFVTGGTYNGSEIEFTNITGGTFDVTGFTSGCTCDVYWSAGTGTGTIVLNDSDSPERSGNYSIVGGYANSDFGDFNFTAGALNFNSGDAGIIGGNSNDLGGNLGFIVGSNNTIVSGANAAAIVGGGQNVLTSGATASAIIGGLSITGVSASTVYVPNLNIDTTPSSGSTSDEVLVRSIDGTIKSVTQTSITGGPLIRPYTQKAADYTGTTTDCVINYTTGTWDFTFPSAVGYDGQEYIVKNSGTGIITLNTTSGQIIDSFASGILTLVQWDAIMVISDGANWIKIN